MRVDFAFGPLLRRWRTARQMSQQSLAEQAEVSTRHISFIETGRSVPSREMVLVLASVLDLPLRERNALLAAAGYAAVYRASPVSSPEMKPIRRALDYLLRQQEPYGALVVDRTWNVLEMNQGAARMFAVWLDASDLDPIAQQNVLHATFHPRGLRRYLVNWEQVASALVVRLRAEMLGPAVDELAELLDGLLRYPDVPARVAHPDIAQTVEPVLPVHLRRGELDVRLFTMVTTLGTPLDVVAQELRIESYFPADDATEAWIRELAGARAG